MSADTEACCNVCTQHPARQHVYLQITRGKYALRLTSQHLMMAVRCVCLACCSTCCNLWQPR